MSKTEKNLKEAFAGESQANRKYLAFAKKAELEGFKQAAKLFRAAAGRRRVHAHAHLRELKGIRSTKENLEEAISGESYEFQKMYPEMIADAKAEGVAGALRSFEFANAVEKIHAALYKRMLENLGKTPRCGLLGMPGLRMTVEGEAPDECPVCKAKKQAFKKVD